jgi:TATA-box binding protein (TBP) (component of TFIID and TFIIIB)
VPVCHNIVSTSQVQCAAGRIDLQRVALLLPNSRYDRKRFAAITIRIEDPTCTGLLFSSGKLVITGSVSMYACILAAHTISRLLRECDETQEFRVISCVVQNIVAHAEVPAGHNVDVEAFYRGYCEFATYQKSVFPGLVFRPPHSPIVLLIFARCVCVCVCVVCAVRMRAPDTYAPGRVCVCVCVCGSGKIVCTGGKSCDDILLGFRRLYPLIRPFIVRCRETAGTRSKSGGAARESVYAAAVGLADELWTGEEIISQD